MTEGMYQYAKVFEDIWKIYAREREKQGIIETNPSNIPSSIAGVPDRTSVVSPVIITVDEKPTHFIPGIIVRQKEKSDEELYVRRVILESVLEYHSALGFKQWVIPTGHAILYTNRQGRYPFAGCDDQETKNLEEFVNSIGKIHKIEADFDFHRFTQAMVLNSKAVAKIYTSRLDI
jgi:hypothetical protein